MLYHYIDETYKECGGYWHCIIGGLLVPAASVVDIEIQLSESIQKCNSDVDSVNPQEEFKCTSFFEEASDQYKYDVLSEFVRVIRNNNLDVLASHAYINKKDASGIAPNFGSHQNMIQMMAFQNMSNFLSPITSSTQVQTVVDLGLNESFKPIYQMYVSGQKNIPIILGMGVDESDISISNFRNLPTPLFIRSEDSKCIQISDVIIGLLLAKKMGTISKFKGSLYETLEPIMPNIGCHSIHWNNTKEA